MATEAYVPAMQRAGWGQGNAGPVRLVGVETDVRVNPDVLAGPPTLIDGREGLIWLGGQSR